MLRRNLYSALIQTLLFSLKKLILLIWLVLKILILVFPGISAKPPRKANRKR
jgi:hypothetical protein